MTFKAKLLDLTKEMWDIEVVEDVEKEGGVSVVEQQQQNKDEIKAKFIGQSEVKALLKKFPSTVITVSDK